MEDKRQCLLNTLITEKALNKENNKLYKRKEKEQTKVVTEA